MAAGGGGGERAAALADWLQRLEHLHPREIDLTLERVVQVRGRLGLRTDALRAVTVAGTNGKGSCVAFLEAVLRAAGYRTGAYTSPHLQRHNERIRVDGEACSDAELIDAFERVEAARGDVPLTYFEFGTLAALHRFREAAVDVALLEVGLGGRLDAVNCIDPQVAVLTSVGLDHQEWLGADREAIGAEKAGVFRAGRPAIVGDARPPRSVLDHGRRIGARLLLRGVDFDGKRRGERWDWHGCVTRFEDLPLPAFGGDEQIANAACALAALEQLALDLPVEGRSIRAGLTAARPRARLERFAGDVEWIVDVAHNVDAAAMLAADLAAHPAPGRTLAVVGMMANKAVEAVAARLDALVSRWFTTGIGGPRGLDADALAARLAGGVRGPVAACATLSEALQAARAAARSGDRIVVFGSFLVAGPALAELERRREATDRAADAAATGQEWRAGHGNGPAIK